MTATSESTTVPFILRKAADRLHNVGIMDPMVDAELIVGHVLGVSRGRVQALVVTDAAMTAENATEVESLVVRRSQREPLQHITGRAPFRSLDLRVGPGVFVPRPETEVVAQFAIDALRVVASAEPIAVDLGTGSGAIALSMATEVPHSKVFAVELSTEASEWTKQNFAEVAAPNATLVFGDLENELHDLDGTVAVVVSNPPYVPSEAIPRDPEVRLFDPPQALYGGIDGLDVVRAVSKTGQRLLYPGGTLIIEHGELQGEAIRSLLRADGWHACSTHRDLTTRDRATTAVR